MPNSQPVVLRMRINRLENHSELPEIQRNRKNIVDRHYNIGISMDQFWLQAMGDGEALASIIHLAIALLIMLTTTSMLVCAVGNSKTSSVLVEYILVIHYAHIIYIRALDLGRDLEDVWRHAEYSLVG